MFRPLHSDHSIFVAGIAVLVGLNNLPPSVFGKSILDLFPEKTNSIFDQSIKEQDPTSATSESKIVGNILTVDIENMAGTMSLRLEANTNLENSRISLFQTSYTRWNDFLPQIQDVFNLIGKKLIGHDVLMVELFYIDQFIWTDPSIDFSWDQLLDMNSKYLPPIAQDKPIVNTQFNWVEDPGLNGYNLVEKIIVSRSSIEEAQITHICSSMVPENTQLDLNEGTKLLDQVQKLHERNKIALNDILTTEMASKINLYS